MTLIWFHDGDGAHAFYCGSYLGRTMPAKNSECETFKIMKNSLAVHAVHFEGNGPIRFGTRCH